MELALQLVGVEYMRVARDKPIYDVLEIAIPVNSRLHVKMNETQKHQLNKE